jgi:alkylation response protein AidB-like acyl-CoA dehydrogenase
MDFALSDEQSALKSVTADFVNREIMPYAAEWDRAEQVDLAIVGKLADMGIFGMTIPEQYGGSGGDHIAYCIAMEELGRGDSSVRGIVSVSLGLVAKTILAYGTEDQKHEWLPKLCRGEALGLLRPHRARLGVGRRLAGDPGRAQGRLLGPQRDQDVHHQRHLGQARDRLRPYRRTRRPGHQRVPGADRPPGLQRPRDQGQARPARSGHRELILDAVEVPDAWRLGEEGKGFAIAMSTLDKGRMSLAAGCVGIGQGCLDASVEYAKQRTQFGRPIAGFQLVQALISDIAVETAAARLLVWKVADLIDRGLPFAADASIAKLFASEMAGPRRQQRAAGLRRLRLRRRVPGRQVPPRRPGDHGLRGHQPGPAADHRPLADGHSGVLLAPGLQLGLLTVKNGAYEGADVGRVGGAGGGLRGRDHRVAGDAGRQR